MGNEANKPTGGNLWVFLFSGKIIVVVRTVVRTYVKSPISLCERVRMRAESPIYLSNVMNFHVSDRLLSGIWSRSELKIP
jgi:hypothetical protein